MYKSKPSVIGNNKLALDVIKKKFQSLTANFDLEDWRTVRNELYWKSDLILNEYSKWSFKVELIEYYYHKGVPITNEKQMTKQYAYIDRK